VLNLYNLKKANGFGRATEEWSNNYKRWIEHDSLEDVIVRMHLILIFNKRLLNGDMFAKLAKKMIEVELKPGGPYIAKDKIYANSLIANFFQHLNVPLTNTEEHIRNKTYKPQNQEEQIAINLSSLHKTDFVHATGESQSETFAKNEYAKLNVNNQKYANDFLQEIIKHDKYKEISNISTYFYESLNLAHGIESDNKKLGFANICAWTAYTIYDDIIDDESRPKLLSLANIMNRWAYKAYMQYAPKKEKTIDSYFDSVDDSNLWELVNCRFTVSHSVIKIDKIPDYVYIRRLAKKSLGHFLGPVLILSILDINSKTKKLFIDAFDKYLIAKQISDDLKDWKEDLQKGHISFVVAELIKSSNTTAGEYDLKELTETFTQEAWKNVSEKCLSLSIKYLKESKAKLKSTNMLIKDNQFETLIVIPLLTKTERGLQEFMHEKEFMSSLAY
jgi:hypothetical protein